MKKFKPMSWNKVKQVASADATCRALVLAAVDNRDGTARLAFRDRVQELGGAVPNIAYWSFLECVVLTAAVAGGKRVL